MDSTFECGACGARVNDLIALQRHEQACEGFLDLPFGEIAPTGPAAVSATRVLGAARADRRGTRAPTSAR